MHYTPEREKESLGTKDLISSDLDADMKNSWGTDPVIFNAMDKEFNFSLDAACSAINTKVPRCFLTKEADAISYNWHKKMTIYKQPNFNVWINPPYGKGYIKKFMQKCN